MKALHTGAQIFQVEDKTILIHSSPICDCVVKQAFGEVRALLLAAQ